MIEFISLNKMKGKFELDSLNPKYEEPEQISSTTFSDALMVLSTILNIIYFNFDTNRQLWAEISSLFYWRHGPISTYIVEYKTMNRQDYIRKTR